MPVGKRIVVLCSGEGSNLGALLDADLGGRIVAVLVDREGAGAARRAREAGIPALVVRPGDHADRADWDAAVVDAVATAAPDLVVLAGFMRVLGVVFVRRFPTLNVHPSLLPAFPGAHAVAEALAHGVKLTGCTVHYVVEEVDAGPIAAQEAVPVHPGDTPDSLHGRIREVEHRLLPHVVALHCRDRLRVRGRIVQELHP